MGHIESGENCKTKTNHDAKGTNSLQCGVTWPSDGAKSGVHEHRGRVENLRVKQNAKATNTLDLPPVSVLLRSVDLFDCFFLPRHVGNSSTQGICSLHVLFFWRASARQFLYVPFSSQAA